MDGTPPPPPPHGANPGNTAGASSNGGRYRTSTDLPDGPYDIFVIPPHSSGSGFLYLPSLQCQRNSFLAGVAATLVGVALYVHVLPVLKSWFSTVVANGGMGVFMLVTGVAVAAWAFGRTQSEAGSSGSGGFTPGGTGGAGPRGNGSGTNTPPNFGGPQPGANFGGSPNQGQQYHSGQYAGGQHHYGNTQSGPKDGGGPGPAPSNKREEWDKAREDAKRREEVKRKMEEFRKNKKEQEQKKKEQEEREAKEQQQKREKEAREREFREWKEKRAKEKAEKDAAEKAAAEKAAAEKAAAEKIAAEKAAAEKAAAEKAAQAKARSTPPSGQPPSPQKKPPFASVKTATEDDAYSFRPYDRPRPSANKSQPAPSIFSESSYSPSHSTARTTPPPSRRGPYTTKDPDKVIINGVYSFNNTFMRTPVAQLVSGQGHVTDGLIMRITTEGMFVDDDVRGVAQREWDIKAWTLKAVETAVSRGYHIVRASLRDQEGKKYVFILQDSEGWKVTAGLQKLRKGSQARALGVCGLPANETAAILGSLGY